MLFTNDGAKIVIFNETNKFSTYYFEITAKNVAESGKSP
jgi:hypothetical protein